MIEKNIDDYEKYIEAKKCLFNMVIQFFSVDILINELDSNLESDYIELCSHQFSSDGLLAWKYLNLDKDFYILEEMWDLKNELRHETMDNYKDYYTEYLKMSILLIEMTTRYYSKKYSVEELEKYNIKYDEDDEYGGKVDMCRHNCESAGESVWNLFNIDKELVSRSVFDNIRIKYEKELLNNEEVKKLIRRKYETRDEIE